MMKALAQSTIPRAIRVSGAHLSPIDLQLGYTTRWNSGIILYGRSMSKSKAGHRRDELASQESDTRELSSTFIIRCRLESDVGERVNKILVARHRRLSGHSHED